MLQLWLRAMESDSSIVARLLLKGRCEGDGGPAKVTAQQEYAMDLSANTLNHSNKQSKSNLTLDNEEMWPSVRAGAEPIEALKCAFCSVIAENTPDLFRHQKYHHQQTKTDKSSVEIVADEGMSMFSASILRNKYPVIECTSAPECSGSPSLRELLKKKDQSKTSSVYLTSIVKAVMKDKNKLECGALASDQKDDCDHLTTDKQPWNVSCRKNKAVSDCSSEHVSGKEVRKSPPICGKNSETIETVSGSSDIIIKDEPSWNGLKLTSTKGQVYLDNSNSMLEKDASKSRHSKRRRPYKYGQGTAIHVTESSVRSPTSRSCERVEKATQCELVESFKVSSQLLTGVMRKDSQYFTPATHTLACHYCDIYFSDQVLHSIHMGCHNVKEPFLCNVCGRHCDDKYGFYTHIMRGHQQAVH